MNTSDKLETKKTPAYASYESFNTLLDRMKPALPLPRPLDSTFWLKMKFSGSTTSALKSALLFLCLLTQENMPTDELEELVKTPKEQRPTIYRKIMDKAYIQILTKLELERATSGQLKAEFRNLGADGQVGQKAMSFFLAMAKESGLKMHPHLTARQPRTLGPKQHVLGTKRSTIRTETGEEELHEEQQQIKLPDNIHPAVIGLLEGLPKPGKDWSEDEKNKFKLAFEALLDVFYPAKKQ